MRESLQRGGRAGRAIASDSERERAQPNDLRQLLAIGGASELCAASWIEAATALAIRRRTCGTACRGGACRGSASSAGRGRALCTGVRTSLSDKDNPRLTHRSAAHGAHGHTPCAKRTQPTRRASSVATLQLASVRAARVGTAWACAVPLRTAAAPSGIALRAAQ